MGYRTSPPTFFTKILQKNGLYSATVVAQAHWELEAQKIRIDQEKLEN